MSHLSHLQNQAAQMSKRVSDDQVKGLTDAQLATALHRLTEMHFTLSNLYVDDPHEVS